MSVTVSALLYFVFAGFNTFDSSQLANFMPYGVISVLEASAVLFFAFTGYARIATLGEEVADPQRTIPRAIIITLVSSTILYSLVALVSLGAIGAENMAIGGSPIFSAAKVMTWPAIRTIVSIAATTAMLGVLLSQVLGTSRMFFAMGRRHDIPEIFSRLSEKNRVPVYGILLSTIAVLLTVWLGELKFITQTASFTILVYYSIANLSATRLSLKESFLPRWIPWFGFVLCIIMAFSLPVQSIFAGLSLLILGHLSRLIFKAATQ